MTRLRLCLLLACCLIVSRPAFAAPGAAVLLLPSGEVTDTTIAFSWEAAPESTWYLFWLGKGAPTAFVMEQWYSAEQAGCANGGVCTITLTPPIGAGSHVWFVQTWGAGVTGPWSAGKVFVVRNPTPGWSTRLPDSRRFTVVFDDLAVLDNETGLVWDRAPVVTSTTWDTFKCERLSVNGRSGWRRPAIAELSSLLDVAQTPGLPAGHPFTLGAGSSAFWSETIPSVSPSTPFVVDFATRSVEVKSQSLSLRNWCVRGPGGVKQ